MGRRSRGFRAPHQRLYDRVEGDELLSPFFPGGVSEEHRNHMIAWWSEVFGGPRRYTEELGGYERMVGKHRDLGINPEQRFRFASLMSLAADDAELPSDPGFRSAFVAYVNGERGWRCTTPSPMPTSLPTRRCPRWGWGEAPPYQP